MELYFIMRFAWAAVQACRDMGGFLSSVLIAMFCLETGYGRGNGCAALMLWFNLLGMKAELHKFFKSDYWDGQAAGKTTPEYYGHWTTIEDAFCVYTSAYQCCMDFLHFMRDGIVDGKNYKYRDLMACKDYKTITRELRVRGYATDPEYDEKLNDIIKRYNLTKFDGSDVPTAPEIVDRVAINAGQVPEHNANGHKYLALHYLGKEGENPDLYGGGKGGHFYVSKDGKCYQAALVTDKIWHVGASSGFEYVHPDARNSNTVGIECATYEEGGGWYFTEATQRAAAQLAAWVMFCLDIPADRLLRHGDITSKHCPAPYMDYEGQGTNWTWDKFREEVKRSMSIKRTLRNGMNGEDVRELQAGLMKLGFCDCQDYFNIAKFCDGDFAGRTERYVKIFQRSYGLKVDGWFGPLSRAAFEKALAEGNFDKFNFTAKEAVAAGLEIGKLYQEKGYKWASAEVAPWNQPWVYESSCDRGVAHTLAKAGILLGNVEAKMLAQKLRERGAVQIGDVGQIKAGDIVFFNTWHVCMAASGRDANGNYKRIDFGSDKRMEHGQPHVEPFNDVMTILRPPYKVEEKPAPKPETGKAYRVQAGLFSIKENAERKVAQLKAAGFDALIIEE